MYQSIYSGGGDKMIVWVIAKLCMSLGWGGGYINESMNKGGWNESMCAS